MVKEAAINNRMVDFEEAYIQVRRKENRIYTDDEVLLLPDVSKDNHYRSEWMVRKNSSERLISYLEKKRRALSILEVGCGNGWLSNKLSRITQSNVTANDINQVELNQARRIFHQTNLRFIHGDFREVFSSREKFDVIVFAASIQYFPSASETIASALKKLNSWGEVHIIDSFFYSMKDVHMAKERTKDYFLKLGNNEMTDYYFHHCINELSAFNYSLFYDPNNPVRKFWSKKSPFHWICVKASE